MSEPALDREDVRLLFEALFDIRALLSKLVSFVEGGENDGGEEAEEEPEEPDGDDGP